MTYCSYCGNKLTNNANFCNSCGSEVNGYSYHNNPSTPHPKFQQRTSAPNTYAILGWIFNGLSIFFIPIIFVPLECSSVTCTGKIMIHKGP